MKLEEQRIAIAEACGWKYDPTAAPDMKYVGIMCWIRPGNSDWQTEQVPDYLNDLNAMHEAEKVLGSIQQNRYISILSGITSDVEMEGVTFATAAQRAEAFLKTLNLWKP